MFFCSFWLYRVMQKHSDLFYLIIFIKKITIMNKHLQMLYIMFLLNTITLNASKFFYIFLK